MRFGFEILLVVRPFTPEIVPLTHFRRRRRAKDLFDNMPTPGPSFNTLVYVKVASCAVLWTSKNRIQFFYIAICAPAIDPTPPRDQTVIGGAGGGPSKCTTPA